MTESTIGVDVSKNELVVALLQNNKVSKNNFQNNKAGFNKFNKWIIKQNAQKSKICMESTGNYSFLLAKFLHDNGYEVYVVNPFSIKSFSLVKLSRNKTDEADAVIIAEYIKVMKAHPFKPSNETSHNIKYMYRCIDDLLKQKTQAKNHLENIKVLPKEVVKVWNKLIKTIDKQICNLEDEIELIIHDNKEILQDYQNLQTIPGISKKTAITILAEIPDVNTFKNARQLAAFAGLTPQQRQSGSSVRGRTTLSKIGSRVIRKAMYWPAIVAKRFNPIIAQFCKNLEKKGKITMVIVGAAMRKMIHIIFGVLKNKTAFNAEIAVI